MRLPPVIWPTPRRAELWAGIRAHANPALSQNHFWLRNDDGSETAATGIAAVDTDASIDAGTILRARFSVLETAGGSQNNVQFQLQYQLNAGGWLTVSTTSSVIVATASSFITDEQATTQQISTGTFVVGACDVDGLAGEGNQIDYAGNDVSECEFCVQIVTADVADADQVQLRLLASGVVLNAYPAVPTVTVVKAAGGGGPLAGAFYYRRLLQQQMTG